MPRNFYRRVEVMFPIEQADLRDRILHEIIPAHLMDNVKARILQADGCYVRAPRSAGEPEFRAQERLLALRPGPTTAASDLRLAPVGANAAAADSVAAEGAREAFGAQTNGAVDGIHGGNGAAAHDDPVHAARNG